MVSLSSENKAPRAKQVFPLGKTMLFPRSSLFLFSIFITKILLLLRSCCRISKTGIKWFLFKVFNDFFRNRNNNIIKLV